MKEKQDEVYGLRVQPVDQRHQRMAKYAAGTGRADGGCGRADSQNNQ